MQKHLQQDSHFNTPADKLSRSSNIWEHFKSYRYGTDPRNVLYLYVPNEADRNLRLVLLVHGGNYLSGSAQDSSMATLARFFAERGYAVASIDYRTLTTHRWPVPVLDVVHGIEHTNRILLHNKTIDDITYVGYSAGAVTGALLFYSDQFPSVKNVDRFIGLSGLYDKNAVASDPITSIKRESLEGLSILKVVEEIRKPKLLVPALLIEGTQDYFADNYPGTSNSHAVKLAQLLHKNGIAAQIFWAKKPGYSDHNGPVSLIAAQDPEIIQALENFLKDSHSTQGVLNF